MKSFKYHEESFLLKNIAKFCVKKDFWTKFFPKKQIVGNGDLCEWKETDCRQWQSVGITRQYCNTQLYLVRIIKCSSRSRKIFQSLVQVNRDVNRYFRNWTLIVDLEGLSMRHLWRPGKELFF